MIIRGVIGRGLGIIVGSLCLLSIRMSMHLVCRGKGSRSIGWIRGPALRARNQPHQSTLTNTTNITSTISTTRTTIETNPNPNPINPKTEAPSPQTASTTNINSPRPGKASSGTQSTISSARPIPITARSTNKRERAMRLSVVFRAIGC